MITIGILGGVASGKSAVANMLGELGAGVLDADRAGHQVLSEPEVHDQLRCEFGDRVFDASGAPNRSRLAEIVFGEGELADRKRQRLESILHPAIRRRLEGEVAQFSRTGGKQVVVLDAPLLLEAGWDGMCDLLVFVDTSKQKRLELAHSRGWDAAELERREQSQGNLDEKRHRADVTLANSGDIDMLREAVRGFWQTHVLPRIGL